MNVTNYDYVTCRELSHAWDPGGYDERPGTFGVARVLRCLRCETKRHDIYGPRGVLIARQYKYPDDYQLPRGEPRVVRDEWREESMRRAGVKVTRKGNVVPIRRRSA